MDVRRRQVALRMAWSLAVPAWATAGTPVAPTHRRSAVPGLDGAFFGMHFHRLVPAPGNRMPTRWPDVPIGSLRLWDTTTRWADVAPYRDRWDFERLDGYVESAESHGASLVYTLGSPPRWAAARPDEDGPYGPGSASPPASMADWQEYVERVVTRYRGRIAAYELWNEPTFSDFAIDRKNPAFFTGSVAEMVALGRAVRASIDRNDPNALLATPGFVNGPHRLEAFLARGGAKLVDVVAYHFYAADAVQFSSQIADVRSVMDRFDLARLPLWNSECGVDPAPDPDGSVLAADRMVQFLLLAAALRVDRFYYYAWDNDRTGMVDREGAPNARAGAFGVACRWLTNTRLTALSRLPGGGFRVDAVRGADRLAFAWSDQGELFSPAVANGFRVAAIEVLRGPSPEAGSPTRLSSSPVAYILQRRRTAAA